jgi:hypothetical protein
MNRLEKWLFNSILRNEIKQGFHCDDNLTEIYSMIDKVCREEFNEDSRQILDQYQQVMFDKRKRFI